MKSHHFWTKAIILMIYCLPIRMHQFGDQWSPNKFTERNVTSRWIVPQIIILNFPPIFYQFKPIILLKITALV